MSALLRQPTVGAVSGGVGTTLVANLIHAVDAGRIPADGTSPVDVLVAQSTASSVKAAISAAAAMSVPPVLVVVAHSKERWSAPVEQRLKMCEPNLPGVVRMGWIGYLAGCDDPSTELVAGVNAQPPPKWAASALVFYERLLAAVTPLVMRPAPQPYGPTAPSIGNTQEYTGAPPAQVRVS